MNYHYLLFLKLLGVNPVISVMIFFHGGFIYRVETLWLLRKWFGF